MKGKLKLSLKIVLTAALLVCAGVGFALLHPKVQYKKDISAHAAYKIETLDGEEFSAKLGGDVILSVEKVSVDENENYSSPFTGANKFYQRDSSAGEKPIYFQNIVEGGKSKQVVEDGQFVMLNNKYIGGKYINKSSQSDALMISLGQYVYYNGNIDIAPSANDDSALDIDYAQITMLDVTLTRNGVKLNDLAYRNISTESGSRFYDFAYLIAEKQDVHGNYIDIEGHYVLTTTYMKGGEQHTASFHFYLVCETTYTQTKTIGGQVYTAAPMLGWTDNHNYQEKGVEDDGYVHYYEGINGLNKTADTTATNYVSYPTITYDYTKYQLSYTLTANKNITFYSLNYKVKENTEVEMVCDISGAVKDSKSFELTNYDEQLKLVTIVFTEQGNYNFSFKYLYTGADKAKAPTMDRLKIEDKKLAIHGVDLNYSKQNFMSAQFRKFNFATNNEANVNLIIPSGYEQNSNISKYENTDLGLMYTLNDSVLRVENSKNIRVGEVVISDNEDRTEDTLQNFKIDLDAAKSTKEEVAGLAQSVLNSDTFGEPEMVDITEYDFNYIKTNQGSMWLTYTDEIAETKDGVTVSTNGSFYFYSRNILTKESIYTGTASYTSTAKPYNNQTSFNQVGYYLVFIKITINDEVATDDFWQVYAFQYMSDTIDIKVTTTGSQDATKNGLDVGAGKFTKENVTVSWKEPETFETKINGYYYKVTNNNATREQLLSTTKFNLVKDTQVLGADVKNNQFAKYLIKLERAGKSATYKMFTIDRQPISGVAAYAVRARASSSSVYYEYAVDKNNDALQIKNGITNSLATLDWNKKASGAQITATYSYTPFVADDSAALEMVNGQWITTKYKLGTTIENCSLEEVVSQINVAYDSVLFGQGIYIFTIIDEAGNATKYMLIIDQTEAHLQVDNAGNKEILPNGTFRLYGENITYTTGTHKVIELNALNSSLEISKIMPYLIGNNLASYKDENGITYYIGDGKQNITSMNNLFNSYNGVNYVTVKNIKVTAYNDYSIDNDCSATNYPPSGQMVFDRDKLEGATSLYRTLYIVGDNMTYSASFIDPNHSSSFVNIEINKDNSRGMVYYSNTEFDVNRVPNDGSSGTNVIRLQTGSEFTNAQGKFTSGVNGANAGKDKFFAFTWIVGEDIFTVKTVKYQYYSLDLSSFNIEDSKDDTTKYFYNKVGDEVVLYDSIPQDTSVVIKNGRGFFLFKTDYDDTTKPGLYKVTRYYAEDVGDEFGEDTYELTYYFIVDRNGILDVTNEIGKEISIGLLEETKKSGGDLELVSSKPYSLQYFDAKGEIEVDESYYIYFTTNKVPAILNIPTGKYYNAEGSSRYYKAGQLKVSVYYQDLHNQLNPDTDGTIYYKLFEKSVVDESDVYKIDFYEYLTKYDLSIRDKMIANSTNGKSWLHLKGRYVVVIEDNVKTSSKNKNIKLIGFEIKPEEYPEANILVGGVEDADKMSMVVSTQQAPGVFEVMTNQEFVRVELPKYLKEITPENIATISNAQIDDQYILIKQNWNNGGETNYTYAEYGTNFVGRLEKDANGVAYVYLDTKLRDGSGNVIKENLSKPLYYTVTVRYKIGKNETGKKELYRDCYSYIRYNNGVASRVEYCYSTYTIIIDRLAPTINVEDVLKANDTLIKNDYIDVDFEADYYQENKMYFTYQYADYYNNGKLLSDIYAFRVSDNTPYNVKKDSKVDIDKIYISSSNITNEDLKTLSLNLPIVSFVGFTEIRNVSDIENFGNIFGGKDSGHYQVIEMDKAGNVTQYIVYYTNSTSENLKLPVSYTSTTGDAENYNIGLETSAPTIELFDIASNGEVSNSGDYFYYISLTDNNNTLADGWQPLKLVTNFATNSSGANSLTNLIINKIAGRKGSYELSIVPRAGQVYKLGISVYSEDDKVDLDIERLIRIENNKYFINLRGANILKNNNMFYAKEIIVVEKEVDKEAVEKRYICKIENGRYNYYFDNNTPEVLTDDVLINNALLTCKDNTTYKLTLMDVFGRYNHTRFNTAGKAFYTINFADFGNYYIDEQGHYYAFSEVEIVYDEIFKIEYGDDIRVVVDNNYVDIANVPNYVVKEGNKIKIVLDAAYNKETGKGSILNVILQFRELDNSLDRTYNITIDTSTQNVSLKDFTTGENKTLKLYSNIDISKIEDLKNYKPEQVTSGIMNLSWTKEEKDNYKYEYHLFELKKDGRIVDIRINNVSNKVIDTQDDSMGVYWFVINVKTPEGKLYGNKIYAFEVQQVNNQLYYVKNEEGLAISPNALFNKEDIKDYTFSGNGGTILGSNFDMPSTNLPLYITNQDLEVMKVENVDLISYTYDLDVLLGKNVLTLYIVDAQTYKLYFGILKLQKNNSLVSNANLNGTKIGLTETQTFVDKENPTYKLYAARSISTTGLYAKNQILLEVYYNGQYITTAEYNENIEYTIYGNGNYSFKIKDLAGNEHIFENETNVVELMILREVVVTINDQVPIENAYYNDEVNLKVFAATKYVTGSIKVTAERNGKEYKIAAANPYIFKDYGTYVVRIEANYKNDEGVIIPLRRILTFSIINRKEARTSIDLTNLSQYEITKVINPNGIDVTSAFKSMLNNKSNAMLVTHDDVMSHSSTLKVSAGKLLFTMEYLVKDNIYPERTLQIQFTLNNEKPVINSSLALGETTTKSFSISFNPGIIYEQIGESYIYINDKIAYKITENSPSEVIEISRSYKEHGDGDYYIKLVGTSGNIWQSFKAEIKEPLNTWAIVIIIAVVAVVGTVVITIIVLRRKMRIR